MTVLDALRDVTEAGVRLDVPVRIARASCGPAGYVADLEVLDAGMEPTGEVLGRMPLPRHWLSEAAGVWAPPDDGVIVVAQFAFGSSGWPVLVGMGELSRDEAPRESVPHGEYCIQGRSSRVWVRPDEVALQDAGDDGAQVRVAGDRVEIVSSIRSLRSALEEVVDAVSALTTTGPPAPHTASAGTRQALATAKMHLQEVLA